MTFIPTSQITRSTHKPDEVKAGRLPDWFRIKIQRGERYKTIRQAIDTHGLHTICEEARCPNQWECWNHGTATFLILGDICTRRCGYCSVTTGRPLPIDRDEPHRIGETVRLLDLRHAVITSVNRDELPDGGASIFAETIASIRRLLPSCTIEVLIPDFQGSLEALDIVMQASPDILNHNIETVPRLFPAIRPQGKYQRSLELLERGRAKGGRTKSGLMVGLGESSEEISTVMKDLRKVKCQILTIGQYLRPTKNHAPVARYYHPEEFAAFKKEAENLGFAHVESGPLVRSSYHAEEQANLSDLSLGNPLA
ncbi:MAG: lipoyl synthase [Nitrospirales bacterium]